MRVGRADWKVVVGLGVAIALALTLFLWTVPGEPGVTTDSITYLELARTMMEGKGYQTAHYPPAYPGLLAVAGAFTDDMMGATRWLHAFLFAANAGLVGVIVYLAAGRSTLAMLFSVLVFTSSAALLQIHSVAWSEAAFITFSLAAFLTLALYIAKQRVWMLLASAIFLGLAMTTRYVGVALLPAMIACLIFADTRSLKNRIRDGFILSLVSFAPMALFLLHNLMSVGSSGNRELVFHPVTEKHIERLIHTLYDFWIPITMDVKLKALQLALAAGLLIIAVGILYKNRRRSAPEPGIGKTLVIFTAAFCATYVLFLLVSISLVDAHTPLDSRILSPMYVFLPPFVISVGWTAAKIGNRTWLWSGLLGLLLFSVGANATEALPFAIRMHNDGIGYTSRSWRHSESVLFVTSLKDERKIFSNGADAIGFLTAKQADYLPARYSPYTLLSNPEYERQMETLCMDVAGKRAIIVYLDDITWRDYLPTVSEITTTCGEPRSTRLSDGIVYGENVFIGGGK